MPKLENHPINYERAQQWINFQTCDLAKEIAKYIIKHTRYVSWEKFKEQYEHVFDELNKKIVGHDWCVFFPKEMSGVDIIYKSNYWMLLLLYDYFKEKKYKLPGLVVIENGTYRDVYEKYEYFIALDDCSYSGGQMLQYRYSLNKTLRDRIIVVLPYISNYALKLIEKSYKTIIYGEIMTNLGDKKKMETLNILFLISKIKLCLKIKICLMIKMCLIYQNLMI